VIHIAPASKEENQPVLERVVTTLCAQRVPKRRESGRIGNGR